jgi:hypothetical protein
MLLKQPKSGEILEPQQNCLFKVTKSHWPVIAIQEISGTVIVFDPPLRLLWLSLWNTSFSYPFPDIQTELISLFGAREHQTIISLVCKVRYYMIFHMTSDSAQTHTWLSGSKLWDLLKLACLCANQGSFHSPCCQICWDNYSGIAKKLEQDRLSLETARCLLCNNRATMVGHFGHKPISDPNQLAVFVPHKSLSQCGWYFCRWCECLGHWLWII